MPKKKVHPIWKNWFKYFIMRDTYSKLLFLITVVAGAVWWLNDFSKTTGTIFGALLGVTVVFSFFSYIIVGASRDRVRTKLYDQIYSSAGYPAKFTGARTLNRINIEWKGLRASRVEIRSEGTSNLSRSATEWRTLKQAVIDIVPLTGDLLYADLSHQRDGLIVLKAFSEQDLIEGDEEARQWQFMEELHSLAYNVLGSYNIPLPALHHVESAMVNDRLIPEKLTVKAMEEPSSYDKKQFNSSFLTKYSDPDNTWGFDWTHQEVRVHRIQKDSQEAKQLTAYANLHTLLANSLRRTFITHDSEDWAFTPQMIRMDQRGLGVMDFDVDFSNTDLSDTEKLTEFEDKVSRGLTQLFPASEWDFNWDISMFNKSLNIKNIR